MNSRKFMGIALLAIVISCAFSQLPMSGNLCFAGELQENRKMTERLQVYKCEVCGNIVEVLHPGQGQLVCCDKPMKLCQENTADASREKHVPVIEKIDGGFRVKVGSVLHPMEEKHYIEWIELIAGEQALRVFLSPGMAPEATFKTEATHVTARAYCTIHGLWQQ